MQDSKPWYLSRTILASIVTVATGVGGVLGLPVAGIDNAALTDDVLQAISAVAGLVAIFGRLAASSRIG